MNKPTAADEEAGFDGLRPAHDMTSSSIYWSMRLIMKNASWNVTPAVMKWWNIDERNAGGHFVKQSIKILVKAAAKTSDIEAMKYRKSYLMMRMAEEAAYRLGGHYNNIERAREGQSI